MNEIRSSPQAMHPSGLSTRAAFAYISYYEPIKDSIVTKHSNLSSSLETIIGSQVELLERVAALLQELYDMEKERRYVF